MIESGRAASDKPSPDEFEAIVIGTGFGGAVTACRLVEAGFRICVLERGRRYGPDDLPKFPTEDLFAGDEREQQNYSPPPDFSRWLWGRDQGIYDIRDLDGAMSVQAAGYGGGSLIYANVHMRPPRDAFDRWPDAYKDGKLDPYFDLAAHMLRATLIPQRLAKTVQLKRAAENIHDGSDSSWFRTPLAVNFGDDGTVDFDQARPNSFGRDQKPCDMRGRCWRGCDHQAKNSLDVNYLARAEDARDEDGNATCDIRTLAEVTRIRRIHGGFAVTYKDLLFRGEDEGRTAGNRGRVTLRARYVFLCAGSVNTTELLLKNPGLWGKEPRAMAGPLGSHYFPNSDSLGVVFDCEEPHEADYGPTITSALLYQRATEGSFSQSLEFDGGTLAPGGIERLIVGSEIVGEQSGARAALAFEPVLDWGEWNGTAVGSLVLADVIHGTFKADETIAIGTHARAKLRSVIDHKHWFLVEDGGYPSDLEALTGLFRSPLWLRRNRYLEHRRPRPSAPLRRPAKRLRLQAFADALGGTARSATVPQGGLTQSFGGALGKEFKNIFPEWLVDALEDDRKELLHQVSAIALPVLDRLLAELSKSLVAQIDAETLKKFGGADVNAVKAEVLARGVLRQALQIIAGSEAAIATRAARLFFDQVPGTQGQWVDALGELLLWALAYDTNEGHTGVLLTMGRDMFRGRLALSPDAKTGRRTLTAIVPSRLLDTSSAVHERMLRDIASRGWQGELRTNPAWTTLGRRVTVHSQGGCPMGIERESVTNPEGEVHGCPSLYVMDAAAFPTSVGVNPSATIAAVAEFKVESFIRNHPKSDAERSRATAWLRHREKERTEATDWVNTQGRSDLDPLNNGRIPDTSSEPSRNILGLRFKETADGFMDPRDGDESLLSPLTPTGEIRSLAELNKFLRHIPTFIDAEDAGVRNGCAIEMFLNATVGDLARLISPESARQPIKFSVTGGITLKTGARDARVCHLIGRSSFLEMFVRTSDQADPSRFFHYELHYDNEDGRNCVMHAWKVLRNAPGFDAWLDSSTLFFEITEPPRLTHRGVMRVSIDKFLRSQLPSMDITGTDDAARRSWALAAFYKYFAGELAEVYMMDAKKLQDLLWKLVTGINV
jgi:choline dehydrogenase-like flavoprotein